MALTDLGRFDDALSSYDQALALEPGGASVWNSKGALLMELGRLKPALECFEQALSSSTAATALRAAFWLNKGKALFMLNRYQEARDALVRSHQLDPSPESAAGIAGYSGGIASPSITTESPIFTSAWATVPPGPS